MRRSSAGLIGGLLCTAVLAAVLILGGLFGGGGLSPGQAVAAGPAVPADACIPVAAHDGTGQAAGCVLASDQYAPPHEFDQLVKRYGGVPVYTDLGASTKVGIFAGPLGFVPNALVDQLPALATCHGELSRHLADPKSTTVTPVCTDLLTADGYPSSFLQGETVESTG